MNKSAQIVAIMDNFDFNRVQRAMVALDWKWVDGDGHKYAIPSIERLKSRAYELLIDVIDSQMISCGGFVARNTDGHLSLEFVVANWVAEEEC